MFKQGFILRNCTESSHSPRIYGPEFSCDNFLFVDINPPNSFKNSQKFVGIFAFMYSWNNSEKRCVTHQNKLWRIFCSLLRYRATCIFLMTNVRFRGWEFFSFILSSVFYFSNQFDLYLKIQIMIIEIKSFWEKLRKSEMNCFILKMKMKCFLVPKSMFWSVYWLSNTVKNPEFLEF